MKLFFISLLILLGIYGSLNAQVQNQTSLTADELLLQAKEAAFERKNYNQAISLLKEGLQKSPNYTDLSIFLGRLYTWSDQIDSARLVFSDLNNRGVNEEDFYLAYGSFLYWNDYTEQAAQLLQDGLKHHPNSQDLLLLKAKISSSSSDYSTAQQTIDKLLQINPRHTEARALSSKIRDYTSKNAIGVNYSLTHFDKQFDDNWHILGVSYKRATNIGSFILKANYANKFNSNGLQMELEAYPRINDMFYMYLGAGYSEDVGIFPKYRTGASLYANLPQSFEGELGFRQLYFSDNIWMYTASVGKYYSNYWFNFRTYLTPGQDNISHSYTGTVRYYTKGANDYIGFQIGTGISPEDHRNNLLVMENYKLKTFKVGADYNFSIGRSNLFSVSATYFNQEYLPNQKGNQYDLSIGYSKTF